MLNSVGGYGVIAIMIAAGIGIFFAFTKHKVKAIFILLVAACMAINMYSHPKNFDFIGAQLNDLIFKSGTALKNEVSKKANFDTNSNIFSNTNIDNSDNKNNGDLGKVE